MKILKRFSFLFIAPIVIFLILGIYIIGVLPYWVLTGNSLEEDVMEPIGNKLWDFYTLYIA